MSAAPSNWRQFLDSIDANDPGETYQIYWIALLLLLRRNGHSLEFTDAELADFALFVMAEPQNVHTIKTETGIEIRLL